MDGLVLHSRPISVQSYPYDIRRSGDGEQSHDAWAQSTHRSDCRSSSYRGHRRNLGDQRLETPEKIIYQEGSGGNRLHGAVFRRYMNCDDSSRSAPSRVFLLSTCYPGAKATRCSRRPLTPPFCAPLPNPSTVCTGFGGRKA